MGVCLYTGFWVKLIEPDLEVLTKLVLYIHIRPHAKIRALSASIYA